MGEMQDRGISRRQAARMLGLGQPYLSEIITGTKSITLQVAAKFVRFGMPEPLYWSFVQSLNQRAESIAQEVLESATLPVLEPKVPVASSAG